MDFIIKNEIQLNILVFDISQEEKLKSYCKMHFGSNYTDEHTEVVKKQFETMYGMLFQFPIFKMIQDNIKVKIMDCEFPTTFIASDPRNNNGKIQCQFYQYGVKTADCPCAILRKSDEMYSTICDSLLSMWNDASEFQSLEDQIFTV